jgi:hypothetical protein
MKLDQGEKKTAGRMIQENSASWSCGCFVLFCFFEEGCIGPLTLSDAEN